ncbi:DUF6765 family protein [Butyrivibrio hungatei]|uniref:Uncharacterized protein n=1 Tax=Butyrivibrio hungatei TaxID=185008 RepID=A0A1D9P0D8_9FIRM|nr:DUF6765 family protein [Butyrivibrio hungatei]AOZ95804.1 hypothetical protein bhn_I0770 [Butyrivibrio hungatei]
MQGDFHYYATYCAALLAGYDHKSSLDICYGAQLVDHCSRTWLKKSGGPSAAATTQLQAELLQARTDQIGLCDITRIWAAFHFLPKDLYADVDKGSKNYKDKYRLICGPNGNLLVDTVKNAKGRGLEAAGIAMHVLADTWAHTFFAGTPSLVINNTNWYFYELFPGNGSEPERRRIEFSHNPTASEDVDKPVYVGSVYQSYENSIMNLGHGRAGHLPDYSYIRYVYLPAWGDYKEIIKDNPHDYEHAFAQMVYALSYLNGEIDVFEKDTYAWDKIQPHLDRIRGIIAKRQVDASADWKALGKSISGEKIPDFDMDAYVDLYLLAGDKSDTYLGRFYEAALSHKKMIAGKIMESGNRLVGVL